MKKVSVLSFGLILSLLLTACGQAGASESSPSPSASNTPQSDGERREITPEEQALMDTYREILASPADVQGVVTKVTGNEITLKLIEPIETMVRFGAGGTPPEGFTPGEGMEIPEGFTPGEGGELPEGVTPPEEAAPEGGRFFREGTPADGAPANGEQRTRGNFGGGMANRADAEVNVTYTGEEITVTIPVSLSILSGRSTLASTSLTTKQVLSLWYGEEETIAYAMVMGKAASEEVSP